LVQDRPLDTNRPSLTGGDTVAEVAEVLQGRQHLYLAAARIIIDTAGRSIEQVAECVLTAIRGEDINLGG
jgi:shikimate kinase